MKQEHGKIVQIMSAPRPTGTELYGLDEAGILYVWDYCGWVKMMTKEEIEKRRKELNS